MSTEQKDLFPDLEPVTPQSPEKIERIGQHVANTTPNDAELEKTIENLTAPDQPDLSRKIGEAAKRELERRRGK